MSKRNNQGQTSRQPVSRRTRDVPQTNNDTRSPHKSKPNENPRRSESKPVSRRIRGDETPTNNGVSSPRRTRSDVNPPPL